MSKLYYEFDEERSKDRRTFNQKYPRLAAMKDWLFTSRMVPTTMQKVLKGGVINEDVVDSAFNISIGGLKPESGLRDNLKYLAFNAVGIEGYNPLTKKLTAADGTTKEFYPGEFSWKMFLFSLSGLPLRPETITAHGYPLYSFRQFLRNMIGGWNPIEEKLEGYRVDGDGRVHNGQSRLNSEGKIKTLTQHRWTEKKIALFVLAVIRVPLFVIFNLVTWPFKLVRNLLKVVTEIGLPLFSMIVLKLNLRAGELCKGMGQAIIKRGPHPSLIITIPVFLVVAILSLSLVIGQYALSLVSRVAKAFTSPLNNALLAYNSGVLILGEKYSKSIFSRFVGALGFVLSMALSVTVWTFTLPLAFGALVNAVPALLTPIATLAQSPFIATALAWLTQLPFVAALSTAFGTAFGVVGGALTATFGAAVSSLGALVGVAIPQVVVAFSLVLTAVVMPAMTLVTWGVEALSNAIMQWVEQRPFHTLFAKIDAAINALASRLLANASVFKGKIEEVKPLISEEDYLQEAGKETEALIDISKGPLEQQQQAAKSNPRKVPAPQQSDKIEASRSTEVPRRVFVYQNPETKEYVVSADALKLGKIMKDRDEYVSSELKGIELFRYSDIEKLWKRAMNSDRSFTQQAVLADDLDVIGGVGLASDESAVRTDIALVG